MIPATPRTPAAQSTPSVLSAEDLVAALPGLLRYARSLTRDEHAASDLVQDTVVRALEAAASYRGDASPATWLHRILHHRYVDTVRRDREVTRADDTLFESVDAAWAADGYTVDAAAVVERAETAEDVRDALARLPATTRAALLLHDVEGAPAREVAQIQGVSLPAAKARIRRGRMALVSLLADDVSTRRTLPGVPLRCWDARSRVDGYLDEELDAADRRALERHLQACPTCPALYASLVGVRTSLGGLRDPDTVVPAPLAERVRGHLDDATRRGFGES